jgi:hypothetical protein
MPFRPNPRGGWSAARDESGARVQTILRTVLQVVPGGSLCAGKRSYEDDDRAGFWIGVDADGVARLNVGGPDFYLKWTGESVLISGGLRTKNAYVRVVDQSDEPWGEGITLLQGAWLASGALRWLDAEGKLGGLAAGNDNGDDGSMLLVHAYPRAAGGACGLELVAHGSPYGVTGGPGPVGLALSSGGTLDTAAALVCGGAADGVQLAVTAHPDQSGPIVEVRDAAEDVVLRVDEAGVLLASGGLDAGGARVTNVAGAGAGGDAASRDFGDGRWLQKSAGWSGTFAAGGYTFTVVDGQIVGRA